MTPLCICKIFYLFFALKTAHENFHYREKRQVQRNQTKEIWLEKLAINGEKQCFYSNRNNTLQHNRQVIASQEHTHQHLKTMLLARKHMKDKHKGCQFSHNVLTHKHIQNQLVLGLFATTDSTTCKYAKHRDVGCQENSLYTGHRFSLYTRLHA